MLAYSAAIMSACGFSWVYMIIIGIGVNAVGYLDEVHLEALFSLGYLAIIIPMIGSGLAITVNSLYVAYRTRTLMNTGIAGWNVFAQAYNMYNAISLIPKSVGNVMSIFGGKNNNKDSVKAKIVIAIAIISILGGILTTIVIIRLTARAHATSIKQEIRDKKIAAVATEM